MGSTVFTITCLKASEKKGGVIDPSKLHIHIFERPLIKMMAAINIIFLSHNQDIFSIIYRPGDVINEAYR